MAFQIRRVIRSQDHVGGRIVRVVIHGIGTVQRARCWEADIVYLHIDNGNRHVSPPFSTPLAPRMPTRGIRGKFGPWRTFHADGECSVQRSPFALLL